MIYRPIFLILVVFLSSCKAYKQDIMFKFDDDFTEENLTLVKDELESNYILKPNDVVQLDVFTNKGERLIDPNFELSLGGQGMQIQQVQQLRDRFQYVIQADSLINFPLVGASNIVGLTLYEAELQLADYFEEFYDDVFVKLRIGNRRVFLLGAPGGAVVPLPNENTSLVEVLALAGGLEFGAQAQNIRLIRGKDVFLVDLSTISGMQRSNINVEPGDIIYVEPWRRPWLETLRDISPAVSVITSVITLIVVLQTL